MSKLFHRYFYALDSEQVIASITSQCSPCASVATLPQELQEFTTSSLPAGPGLQFACDVLCRARQRIFVIRDCFSSYTVTRIIPNEQSDSLRDAIIETTSEIMSPAGC